MSSSTQPFNLSTPGIGLRAPHFEEILEIPPSEISFLEVHSENYFYSGSPNHEALKKASEKFPISLHGVALSLGSIDEPDKTHLKKIKSLIKDVSPVLISEHVAWNRIDGIYLNDLLPIPYTEESLDILCRNISITQDFIGQKILLENPSIYLPLKGHTFNESAFLKETASRTGCKLLLDINNVYVTAENLGFSADDYINSFPYEYLNEIHLAGHEQHNRDGFNVLIDTHSRTVCDDVWHLYEKALQHSGPVATLIEWDKDIPPLSTLINEANKAKTYLRRVETNAA